MKTRLIIIGASLLAITASTTAFSQENLIVRENKQEGSTHWLLFNYDQFVPGRDELWKREKGIEGYCSHASIKAGETLKVFVSTEPAAPFKIDCYDSNYRRLWEAGRCDRRRLFMEQSAFPHLREHCQVEKMHSTQHQQHQTDFCAEAFERLLRVGGRGAVFQRERHVADVDEIKSDDQKVVHGIRELLVAEKTVHQKYAPVFMQRARDPDRQRDADEEITEVGCDEPVHNLPFGFLLCRYDLPSFKFPFGSAGRQSG